MKDGKNYTKPELRERLKKKITAGAKGGRAGQWSARKAQLLVREYEEQGGGYRTGKKTSSQKHLKKWGDEKWTTASGDNAQKGKETHRYLPEKAWSKLTAAQKRSTDRKKVAGSRKGKQFVSNTAAAKRARKSASGAQSKSAGKSKSSSSTSRSRR